MLRYLSSILALTVAGSAMGDWSATDTTIGRQVSTGYGIDTVDHYSGQAYLLHTDYQLLLGQDSYLPISRKVMIGDAGATHQPSYLTYNLAGC